MEISESYGVHPFLGTYVFIYTLKVPGKATSYYRKVKMTDRQKRKAKKDFRAYIKSGLSAAQWHDLTCVKCKL